MKLIAAPGRLAALTGLLACVLAATAYASTHHRTAGHPQATSRNVRASGFGKTSKKTLVNLRELAGTDSQTAVNHPFTASAAVAANTAIQPGSAASPITTTPPINATAAFAPALDVNFDGLQAADAVTPPDPNAAASPTQIVEVVNLRLRVYNRNGTPAGCGIVDLNTFFGKQPNEAFIDPRVIYDNANNKFTVMLAVIETPPTGPHLPFVTILRMAHSMTGDACTWFTYSVEAYNGNIAEGSFVDQPAIGQDRDAFLFGGASFTIDHKTFLSNVAFSYPKSCAYNPDCSSTDFPVFHPFHYATPASSGGNPMISTAHSYFVATVPNIGYELYRMDNSGNTSSTSFAMQSAIASAQSLVPPTGNAGQPGASRTIDVINHGEIVATRITSTPTYDGARIWFTHQISLSGHPAVRYGAINISDDTVATAVAFHSATSDDFNPSIGVGVNGASRTIFLNWAYTDVAAGIPVSATVAAIRISSTDSPRPINGMDIKLIDGGITGDSRFGDYSSVSIDPLNPNQVCAVTAQEYFSRSGAWATRISRFGAAGC